MSAKTLYDKLWDSHVVRQEADGTALIYTSTVIWCMKSPARRPSRG